MFVALGKWETGAVKVVKKSCRPKCYFLPSGMKVNNNLVLPIVTQNRPRLIDEVVAPRP